MKEPTLLLAVDQIVGHVQNQNDLFRLLRMRFDKDIDHQVIDRFRGHDDFLVPFRGSSSGSCQFQSIQSALAGQRLATICSSAPLLAFSCLSRFRWCQSTYLPKSKNKSGISKKI